MDKLVSVIITTHNRKELLCRAIDSVLNQTYKNIELIVIDDASSDGTNEVVENYILLNTIPITYQFIEKKDSKGGNYARNRGINLSKGYYVGFLDDDDEWLSDKLISQVLCFRENPEVGCVTCNYNEIYQFDNKEYSFVVDKHYKSIENNIFEKHMKKFPYAFIGVTSTLLIKKHILREVGLFDENLVAYQEVDLIYRIRRRYSVECVNQPLVNYYNRINVSKEQISNSIDKSMNAQNMLELKYKDNFDSLNKVERNYWEFTKHSVYYDRAIRSGDKLLAKKYLTKIIYFNKDINTVLKFIFLTIFGYYNFIRIRHFANRV